MPDVPPLPPTDVPKPSQARRLSLAFQAVFGQPGKAARTSDQRLVLAHLRKVGCADALIFQPATNGVVDTHAAAQRDGARSIVLIIDRQLELARGAVEEERPKPKARR